MLLIFGAFGYFHYCPLRTNLNYRELLSVSVGESTTVVQRGFPEQIGGGMLVVLGAVPPGFGFRSV
jgi:hypothetical protein